MCYGGVDLKHLARETESRLAGLPKVDAAVPSPSGVFARLLRRAALVAMRLHAHHRAKKDVLE